MMEKRQIGDVLYLSFPIFDKIPFIYNAFSTRQGGVSSGVYSTMNLSFGRGDEDVNVIRNFEILCNAIDIKPETLVFSSQTHTSNILTVTKTDCGKGIYSPKNWNDIDGIITQDTDVSLVTHYADCVPLFFADPVKRIVAAAHAGWKGTVLQIASKMVETMQQQFSCNPADILVGIGPSIGQCCFEVDELTANEFKTLPEPILADCIKQRPDLENPSRYKYDINLQKINQNILLQAGVPIENIQIADICTKCNHEWLFSHRATNGQRGGMVAIIGMRTE